LAHISEFSVLSRRSVEKYRNDTTSVDIIAKRLDVNYLVEGRVQKIGDRAIVSAVLILAKENKVLWSESYEEDVSEIFTVQASVIKAITDKLQAIISPDMEIELNTQPTKDKMAYEYYFRGEEYRYKAYRPIQKNKEWLDLLNKARKSYESAIKQDSLYAPAYLGLAMTVWERNYNYLSDENNLDEVLVLANKALQIYPRSTLAYYIRGDYYRNINQMDKAIEDYKKALDIIPNNSTALMLLFESYSKLNNYEDAITTLKKIEKVSISRGDFYRLYSSYINYYRILGEHDMVDYYFNKIFENRTSPLFRRDRAYSFMDKDQFDKAIKYTEENLPKDNQQKNALLGYIYMRKKDLQQAQKYYHKCYKQLEKEGINSLSSSFAYGVYGYLLAESGQNEKGLEIIQKQISINDEIIQSKRQMDKPIYHINNITWYSYLNQYEKVYDQIEKFDALDGWNHWPFFVNWVKKDKQIKQFSEKDAVVKAWIKRGEQQLLALQNQIRPHLPLTPPN
jgi:tetratricopeptide (TPR) repeat protein